MKTFINKYTYALFCGILIGLGAGLYFLATQIPEGTLPEQFTIMSVAVICFCAGIMGVLIWNFFLADVEW